MSTFTPEEPKKVDLDENIENSDKAFENAYLLAQSQLIAMSTTGDITFNSKELIDMLITFLESLEEDEDLFKQAQELLDILRTNDINVLKAKDDKKSELDPLLLLFEVFEPFAYIIPTLRYQLGFSVQNSEECILHLEKLKTIIAQRAQGNEVQFLDRLIEFLKADDGEELHESDLLALQGEIFKMSDMSQKTVYTDCIEYINTQTDE